MTAGMLHQPSQREQQQQQTERIYIGGLDPDRLSPAEVLARIASSLPDDIELVSSIDDVDDDKTYFHVTVRRKNNGDDEDSALLDSALALIAKKYHNVKWKGCKLRIEAAKPHFLERLAQEREERQKQQEENKVAANDSTTVPTCSNIPRHLRIRRRFGQEAHSGDTKPITVEEWAVFSKAVAKMHKRQEKQREKAADKHGSGLSCKKIPYRAVHLRFPDGTAGEKVTVARPEDREDQSSEDDESSTSESLSSTHSSSSESSDSSVQMNGEKPYVWSDDESESEQDTSEHEDQILPRDDDGALSSESDSESPEKTYDGSSSDENDEFEPSQATANREPRQAPQIDEFSAAVDFSSPEEESSSSAASETDRSSVHNADLHGDVKSNLDVLSSLFPEMSRAAPKDIRGDDDVGGDHLEANVQPGWENQRGSSFSATLGTMQRFDPTKESAQKYELEPISKATSEDDRVDSDQGEASDKSHDDAVEPHDLEEAVESTSGSELGQNQNIYQEGKLEDVFRAAREGTGDHDAVTQGGGGFAFGFDLGDTQANYTGNSDTAAKSSDGFAFSFDVGDKMTGRQDEVSEEDSESPRAFASEGGTQEPAEKKSAFRRRGLFFPSKVLQEYTEAFFDMNEGARISEDLDGFRHDDEIKQKWIKERYGLTQDWKRKRKYAQSRMQKKGKYR